MSKAKAVAEFDTTDSCLPPNWIPLPVLSLIGCGSIAVLEDKAREAGVKIDESTNFFGSIFNDEDLEAVLDLAMLEHAREYRPDLGPLKESDRERLGFGSSSVDERDVIRLLELRGVFVQGDQVDRRGVARLATLLDSESRAPTGDTDWLLCSVAWKKLSESMVTEAKWETGQPPPRKREPEPFAEPEALDERRIQLEYADSDEEPLKRCLYMGIRHGRHPVSAFDRGKHCLKFDLYRRMGLVYPQRPGMPIPNIESYQMIMNRAYESCARDWKS